MRSIFGLSLVIQFIMFLRFVPSIHNTFITGLKIEQILLIVPILPFGTLFYLSK